MPVNDPVADMLTRIRNGIHARHESVLVPHSKLKLAAAACNIIIQVNVHVCVYIRMYMYMYTEFTVNMCKYMCMYKHMYMYMYTCIQAHVQGT